MPAMEDDARGEEDLDAGRHCCTRGALVAEEEELEGEEALGRGRRRRNRRRKKKAFGRGRKFQTKRGKGFFIKKI